MEKSLPMEISKAEKSPQVKKKKKRQNRLKEEYHSVKKKKILVECNWYSAPCWRPDFKQRDRGQTKFFLHIKLKMRFLCMYASTSPDTKTFTIALNRNFESCLLICCLASQHNTVFTRV